MSYYDRPPNSTLRRGKPLAKVGAKRQAEEEEWRALKERVRERDNGTCQAGALGLAPEARCWGPLDPDHFVPVGWWAAGRLVDDNVWSLCRGHHDYKHDDLERAVELGLASRTPGAERPRP